MNRLKMYYFFDPMCGWCYGFTNILNQLRIDFPETEIEVICGGMVIGKREGKIGPTGKYVLNLLPRVEKFSGREFGESYKEKNIDGSLHISSLKPSVAICIVKDIIPGQTLDYINSLQQMHFYEGRSLDDFAVYRELAEEFNLDPDDFIAKLKRDFWIEKAKEDFKFSADVGITGYPTLVADVKNKLKLVSFGFNRYSHVKAEMENMLILDKV